jgi:hypothetical protein
VYQGRRISRLWIVVAPRLRIRLYRPTQIIKLNVARCEFNDSFAVFSECEYSNESGPHNIIRENPSGK